MSVTVTAARTWRPEFSISSRSRSSSAGESSRRGPLPSLRGDNARGAFVRYIYVPNAARDASTPPPPPLHSPTTMMQRRIIYRITLNPRSPEGRRKGALSFQRSMATCDRRRRRGAFVTAYALGRRGGGGKTTSARKNDGDPSGSREVNATGYRYESSFSFTHPMADGYGSLKRKRTARGVASKGQLAT